MTKDSFTFTVGKLDAGMAILLGERAHLIEFPSILLPPGATTGSIVNIAVHQNHAEERRRDRQFWSLQEQILDLFGRQSPETPQLEVRNVTQTSVTLEWPPIKLATAKLRSLDLHKNGQRVASIPNALNNFSTKLSGLSVDTSYNFQLILRTSAGTYPSSLIRLRTHTIADTSGISVCFATVQDPLLLENAKLALKDMRAKWSNKVEIDTSHFVCTTPAVTPAGAHPSGGVAAAPGAEYQRALQLNIPVVQPQWILACHSEKRMVPIASYYLGATPPAPSNAQRHQSMSQYSLPYPSSGPEHKTSVSRQSLPAMPTQRSPPAAAISQGLVIHEEPAEHDDQPQPQPQPQQQQQQQQQPQPPVKSHEMRHKSSGTMDKNFKFPPSASQPQDSPPPVPSVPASASSSQSPAAEAIAETETETETDTDTGTGIEINITHANEHDDAPSTSNSNSTPTSSSTSSSTSTSISGVEVPPPPPVEKESHRIMNYAESELEEEVGETVEIDLR